jgi:outer membrane protein
MNSNFGGPRVLWLAALFSILLLSLERVAEATAEKVASDGCMKELQSPAGRNERFAESLPEALVRTYQNNRQLNAERARQRATDETVPQALSGYRPLVSAGVTGGVLGVRNVLPDGTSQSGTLRPWMGGVTITQPLFNGFRTGNAVRQAEAQVLSGREALRNVEQNVLLAAVTAYANVLADQEVVDAQRENFANLKKSCDFIRSRRDSGVQINGQMVTAADVGLAKARVSRARADLNAAEVALTGDSETYRQIVGNAPGRLTEARPIDRLLPGTPNEALAISRREHPTIVSATYDVDTAQAAVKVAEGALAPNISVQGNVSRSVQTDTSFATTSTDQASVLGQATVPIYDGGLAASQVRQTKETLAQIRLVLDQVRTQSHAAVLTAWAINKGSKVALEAAEAEKEAATQEYAVFKVLSEQTSFKSYFDVFNAAMDVTSARVRLALAKRDRLVASYTLLGAMGRLDHKRLDLATPDYEPQTHYFQVRDAWHGLRTPSGQ